MVPARLLVVALAVATSASCILWGGVWGGGKSRKDAQRDTVIKHTPAVLEVNAPKKGEPRKALVRIWVDDDFRAQNVRWRAHIEEQIDEANQFLVPALGVRLEIAGLQPWPARQADRSIFQVLESLQAHDPGAGVTWVIGYTSSLSLVAASFEQLGAAELLGKHLVLRGYADVQERKVFARALPDIAQADRERLHQARRRHKQTTILLHELGHTLGAPHENDETWIMNRFYDVAVSSLSKQSRELMQLTLEERLKPEGQQDLRALAARLTTFIESNPWGGWVEDERKELLAQLAAMTDPRAHSAVASGDVPVPPGALDQFRRAQRLASQRKLDDALAELEALVTAYPASFEIRQAICEVHVGKHGPTDATTIRACERAAEIEPGDPRPVFVRAQALLATGDKRAALALLAQVENRAGDRAELWNQFATIYQGLGMITRAERAAGKAAKLAKQDPHPVQVSSARMRARYGLPPDSRRWKIAEVDEGEYVETVRQLLDLVYASKATEAAALAGRAEKRWRGAPGLLAARCDLQLRQGDLTGAQALCRQAVSAWSGAAWAHYLLGVIAYQKGRPKDAVASLRRAIAAEPDLSQAYRALGKTLKATGDEAGRNALREEYARRFGGALPD